LLSPFCVFINYINIPFLQSIVLIISGSSFSSSSPILVAISRISESEGGEKITDGEQPDVKTQLNPTEIRDQYKKTMREKGLTAATNLIKDLKQQGKVPSNFKL
jgi:hypothetical protein